MPSVDADGGWHGSTGTIFLVLAYMVMAYVVMAYIVVAYRVMTYIVMAYIVVTYIVMAYIVMAYIVMAYVVMAYIVMTYIVMAYIVVAYIVMAYIVTPYIVMAYIVMAYMVMAYIVPAYVAIAHISASTISAWPALACLRTSAVFFLKPRDVFYSAARATGLGLGSEPQPPGARPSAFRRRHAPTSPAPPLPDVRRMLLELARPCRHGSATTRRAPFFYC